MQYLADVVVMSIQFLLFTAVNILLLYLLILGLKHHTYIYIFTQNQSWFLIDIDDIHVDFHSKNTPDCEQY